MKMKRYVALAVLAMSCMAVCAGQWPGGFGDAHMARVRHWEGSPLGPSVAWYNIPGVQIAGLTTDGGKKSFSKCFRLFLDERNYPIDFHCIAGADRTGALAAALEALLGVSEGDIVIDYTLTSLSSSGLRRPESCTRQLRVFNKYPGATLNERVEAYVLDCGFTAADIDKFRSIMLER